jgi:Glycosyl hydrolases family 28/Bacterial Ig-like domain (group 3)
MRFRCLVEGAVLVTAATIFFGLTANAQDSRTVTEPVFPATCSTLQAQQAIVSGEPASETSFDTARLQSALTGCAKGQAVELQTSGTNNAFLIQPITIPTGVTLLVDGGVTVFASRNPADYQVSGAETCGTVGTAGNGCNPLFNIAGNASSTGAGIMGYGVIDGRGEDKLLVNGTASANAWWDIAIQAQEKSGGAQNNFVMLAASKASNFTLYKITFKNSPMFHVTWKGSGSNGLTVWGMKIITPFSARNSDGIDPDGSNITITNSSISDGDDNIAISASSAASNITISNDNTYSGHGISVGSITDGGLSNMMVTNINQAGTAIDNNGIALRLKATPGNGGLLENITYQNICMQNHQTLIVITPVYNGVTTGSSIPQFSNITFTNVHGLTNGLMSIVGFDATHLTTLNLNNFVFDTLTAANLSPAFADDTITLGPGPVSPAFLQSLTGTGVSYNGSVTAQNTAPYPCSASTFTFLVGELYLSTAATTNLSTETVPGPGTVTLNAMLQPAMSQVTYMNSTGTAAPTAAVQFMEGTNVVGTAALGGNGTIASLTLTGVAAGTHTYTAQYPGDSNYAAYPFGSVTVTVSPFSTASTTALMASPSPVQSGSSSVLTATVTGMQSNALPTGMVNFFDGPTMIGSAALGTAASGLAVNATLSTVLNGPGAHSLSAQYIGDANNAASTSSAVTVTVSPTAAPSTTTLTASPSTVQAGSSTALIATVAGTSTTAAPTGTVNFFDGTTMIGSAAAGAASGTKVSAMLSTVLNGPGTHSLSAQYAGDANNGASTSTSVAVTVTAIPTVTTLSLASSSIAASANEALGVTVTSAAGVPSGTVTFFNGTSSLGTATLANGAASLMVVSNTVGLETISAAYSASGNFGASTSSALPLTVVTPLVLGLSPATVTVAAGASGTTTISATPAAGFSGTVNFTCSSPVAYVTCTLTPVSQIISSTAAVQSTLTVSVAATLSQVTPAILRGDSRSIVLSWFLPFGAVSLLGFVRPARRFRRTIYLWMVFLSVAVMGIVGCGGSAAGSSTPPAPSAPSGSQVVTVTVLSEAISQTAQVTVNIGG